MVGHRDFILTVAVLLILTAVSLVMIDRTDFSPKLPPPEADAPYRQAELPIEDRVNDLVRRMSLGEKIGQMALMEKNSVKNISDITKYGLGGMLSGGGGKPKENTPEGWLEMVTELENAALQTRLGIPLLYGIDANHGHGNVPGAVIYPHFIGLGAASDPKLVSEIAEATAEEVGATGVNWIFSPTLDMPKDFRWGRTYEAFSDDPLLVEKLSSAFIIGLQTNRQDGLMILATPKHYLGTGAALWSTSINKKFKIDQGATPADESALRKEYLPPFASAIDSGALTVMVGLNSWGGEKLAASEYLITDVLKKELGFKGFVVSDWYGVYEIVKNDDYHSAVKAINAGVDMVMLPLEYKPFIRNVNKAVARGEISEERINDAVRRILRAKFAAGLFDQKNAKHDLSIIGLDAHRALARTAVNKSLVLLKNENGLLPLSKNIDKVFVAGSGADNVGRQCGGWTVEWQGIDGNWLPGSTSILKGIRESLAPSAEVVFDASGNFTGETGQADIGIAVVSERPYTEGWGDDADPALDRSDIDAISNLKKKSKRVVVIIVSGRPLIISDRIGDWDALVAAWLPGSEGRGVADVIFGDAPFTGKLPLPWPKNISQVPIDSDGKTSDRTAPLFVRGFGLGG